MFHCGYLLVKGTGFLASNAAFTVQGYLVAGLLEEAELSRLIKGPPLAVWHLVASMHTSLLIGSLVMGELRSHVDS